MGIPKVGTAYIQLFRSLIQFVDPSDRNTTHCWSFLSIRFLYRIICFDVRHIAADAHNQLRFGSEPTMKLPYKEILKALFTRTVYNPSSFLKEGYQRNNLCVLASILLTFHVRLSQTPLRRLTQRQLQQELSALNCKGLYQMATSGLALSD